MKLEAVKKYAEAKDNNHKAGKDFKHQVKVEHSDGSKFKLTHAKYEILEMYLIVYTEHHGIQYFHCEDIMNAKVKMMFTKTKVKYKTIVNNR